METEIDFPSHLITRREEWPGKNNSKANMMARRMRQTLRDGLYPWAG